MTKEIVTGVLHKIPVDLRKAIFSIPAVKSSWEKITVLARNEWICWITSAKKTQTRKNRIERMCNDLIKGKRRPCCWPGCPHRFT